MTYEIIISRMLNIVEPVIDKFYSKELDFPIEFTFFHILERLKLNLGSLSVLLKYGIIEHDQAIGLILRSLLTDFITSGYIIKTSYTIEEVTNKLYSLYNSDLKKVDASVKLIQGVKNISYDVIDGVNNRYRNENDLYRIVRDYCNQNNVSTFPTTSSIIASFGATDSKDLWSERIKVSYDLWTFYSKYEHIGISSYEFTRNIPLELVKSRLKSVLFNTSIMLSSCLEILKLENEFFEACALQKEIYETYSDIE